MILYSARLLLSARPEAWEPAEVTPWIGSGSATERADALWRLLKLIQACFE